MTSKILRAAVLAALIAAAPVLAQDRREVGLTLEEAIAKALQNNLSVAVEMYTPQLAERSLDRAREVFLPRFELSYGSGRDENPSYWWISGAGTNWSRMSNYGVSIVETVPTGGSLSLSLQNYKSDTNQPFQLINPRYGSTLRFDFSQPLLRNFGPKVTRSQIILAEENLDIGRQQLRNTMVQTVYLVQEAYWNLVFAIENYKVKQQSLQLGRDLLAKNRKEVEFGTLAPLEILNAEATVAQREADLIQAEFQITRGEEVLKTMLNLSVEGDPARMQLVPVDRPAFAPEKVDLGEFLKTALDRRPDLKILRTTISSRQLNVSVARNQTLPALDLTVSYWSPGISGDRLIYAGNDPFTGVIVDKVKGAASGATRDALKLLYNNWNIGLTLSLPVSSILSRADYAYARAELGQSQVRLKAAEQQAGLEISDAARAVEANAKRVEAYRLARDLAEKSLDAEVKKMAVGLSTNYFVLDFQDKLAAARSSELKARIDYILSVENLEKAAGINLEKRGFKIPE